MSDRRKLAVILLAALVVASAARAEPEVHVKPTSTPTFPELPAVIRLWPGDAPGSEGRNSPLQMRWENYDTTGFGIREDGKAVYSWMALFRTWLNGLSLPAQLAR
jgi:hypothetical protein